MIQAISSLNVPREPHMSILRRAAAVLLHNPACSKSRAALGLLEQSGAAFDTREYLREPLSRAELEELQARLGMPTRWTRRGETAWVERFGDDADAAPSDAACLTALAEAPALLERPIFVHGPFATVGRPPELVLALVGELYYGYTYYGYTFTMGTRSMAGGRAAAYRGVATAQLCGVSIGRARRVRGE